MGAKVRVTQAWCAKCVKIYFHLINPTQFTKTTVHFLCTCVKCGTQSSRVVSNKEWERAYEKE